MREEGGSKKLNSLHSSRSSRHALPATISHALLVTLRQSRSTSHATPVEETHVNRPACVLLLALLLAPVAAPAAAADAWPQKPIRFIVPFVPGGATDLLARYLGEKLTEALGVSVIID